MGLDTKFYVGSVVYCKDTGQELYIDTVNIAESHLGIDIHYRCEGEGGYYYYREDELTDKQLPMSSNTFAENDLVAANLELSNEYTNQI